MAIGTYSQLKTAIETWMARSSDTEISGNATDLVTLAEDRLNRDLPLRVNYTDTTLTGTAGSRALTLPSDFYEPVALWLTTFSVRTMLTPFIAGNVEVTTTRGTPQAWCINGTGIDLDILCDQAHTFLFRYRKSFALSDSATTNWLLTNHPSVYLQACLLEAELLAKDWEAAAIRESILTKMIDAIAWKDARNLALAPLATDAALVGNTGFNINTG
jgi:hypothetical protein